MLDDGFGWSLPRPGIPCSLMNWLALSRKKRCRRYRAWTSRAQSRAALTAAPLTQARV